MDTMVEKQLSMHSSPAAPIRHHHYRWKTSMLLLLLNGSFMLLGGGGPLLMRVYFLHGGCRMWLSSFLQVSGWPILVVPLLLNQLYSRRRRRSDRPTSLAAGDGVNADKGTSQQVDDSDGGARCCHISPCLTAVFAVLGLLIGVDCYLYSYSSSYLPLSISSLLGSSQLAFTAVFALLIVRQRFTPYSINAAVLLTLGPVVLSLGYGSQGPKGESARKYGVGVCMSVAAAALMALVLPLTELAFRKTKAKVTYAVMMEMQLVMGVSGSLFCLAGMLINKDFQAIAREAKEFGLGEKKYYMVLIWGAISWQVMTVGLVGLISGVSSFVAAIVMSALLPVGQVTAFVFLDEKFGGGKAVALVLSLWGFASYMYGEMVESKATKQTPAQELLPLPQP